MKTRLLNAGRLPPALEARLAEAVVDEAALVRALVEKRIAGAGLDVFENEPQVPAELMALDNVVLLPHIASGTRETRQAMADRVFDNLQSFFAAGRLISAAPSA